MEGAQDLRDVPHGLLVMIALLALGQEEGEPGVHPLPQGQQASGGVQAQALQLMLGPILGPVEGAVAGEVEEVTVEGGLLVL